MANYVLVHGAWCGGFVWREVAQLLRAQGHLVFTPTLTGLADRSHLLTPQVDLDTHIRDIVNLMKWEELVEDVVLVGHSYGGMVISGVAEEVPDGTICSIVYLDAFYAPSGCSISDCIPETAIQFTTDPVPFPFQGQTGDPEFERLTTPQPLRSMTAQPMLSGARERVPIKTYVLATALPMPWFAANAARAKEDPTWRYREIACGHGTMREMPEQTTAILLEAAQ